MAEIFHSRAVGHTTAMLNGAKNTDGVIIISATQQFANVLAEQCPNATGFSVRNLERLRGRAEPILIDNWAIETLLEKKNTRIKQLESNLDDVRETLRLLLVQMSKKC